MTLMQRIARRLCQLGLHYDEPMYFNRVRGYVVLRCVRYCARERYLQGEEARRWMESYVGVRRER